MLSLLLLQAASTELPPPQIALGTPLWRDFRVGMTPEQVADVLRTVEGVSQATVKRNSRNKFSRISIKYSDFGVRVGDMKLEIEPVFENVQLDEINLSGRDCLSISTERMKLLRDSLSERYGHFVREKVVDENGVEFEQRAAFWNDDTRVRMSWQVQNPSKEYYSSSGRGVQGALAGLATMLSQQSYEDAVKACTADSGSTVTTTLNYSSQADFLRVHAAEIKAREEKAKAIKQAL